MQSVADALFIQTWRNVDKSQFVLLPLK